MVMTEHPLDTLPPHSAGAPDAHIAHATGDGPPPALCGGGRHACGEEGPIRRWRVARMISQKNVSNAPMRDSMAVTNSRLITVERLRTSKEPTKRVVTVRQTLSAQVILRAMAR